MNGNEMTDKQAVAVLEEAFGWEDFLDTYFEGELKAAIMKAYDALKERAGK